MSKTKIRCNALRNYSEEMNEYSLKVKYNPFKLDN